MSDIARGIDDFFSQPWGAFGAICIMLAVTCFNSQLIQKRFAKLKLSREGMAFILNSLNLLGGVCLLVNAVFREEIVWKFLECYFIIISIKGIWQNRQALTVLLPRYR